MVNDSTMYCLKQLIRVTARAQAELSYLIIFILDFIYVSTCFAPVFDVYSPPE